MELRFITLCIAIWGAVLSTAALGWNVFTWIKERGSIKITAEFKHIPRKKFEDQNTKLSNFLLKNFDPGNDYIRRLLISLFYTGKRPRTIVKIHIISLNSLEQQTGGYTFGGPESTYTYEFKHGLPIVLNDGEFHMFELGGHVINEGFTGIEAVDSNGLVYKLSPISVSNLKLINKSYLYMKSNE